MFPLEEKWIVAWELHSWYLEYFICFKIGRQTIGYNIVLVLSPFILAFSSTTIFMIHTYKSPGNRKKYRIFHKRLSTSGCDLHTQSPSCFPGRSCVYLYWLLLTVTPPCSSESSCSDLSGSTCYAVEPWCPSSHGCARSLQSPRLAVPSLLQSCWQSRHLPDLYLYGKRTSVTLTVLKNAFVSFSYNNNICLT